MKNSVVRTPTPLVQVYIEVIMIYLNVFKRAPYYLSRRIKLFKGSDVLFLWSPVVDEHATVLLPV